jgi:hypothetical protein
VDPFASPQETARRLVGVQAQLPVAATLAFFNRTRRCTTRGLEAARLERRTLVRFWGQRNTVHVYATEDWPLLHAAFADRFAVTQRRLEKVGLAAEFQRLQRRILRRLEKGEQLTHKDVQSPKLESQQDQWRVSYAIFIALVRKGVVCHGKEEGAASRFVHREHWTPQLSWEPPLEKDALAELTRRYLAGYGPATAHDLAFWYGTTLTRAKDWLQALGEECIAVEVDGVAHWCLAGDLAALRKKAPPMSRWPTRLLFRFDPLLLATRDKAWLIEAAHKRKVWAPSAQVEAVLLVRGRIAGTWRYERRAKTLRFRLQPFAALAGPVKKKLTQEAERMAAFLGFTNIEMETT